jgi:signal transduction histidine kinase/PAS domain-containing protein
LRAGQAGVRRHPSSDGASSAEDADASTKFAERVRLLEGFLSRVEITDCVQFALEWLASQFRATPSVCLIRRPGESFLSVGAAHGLPPGALANFKISLEDWSHPLVRIMESRRPAFYPSSHAAIDRGRRPHLPFGDVSVHVLPLAALGGAGEPTGLLMFAGARLTGETSWFCTVLAQKIDQVLGRHTLADEKRQHEHERALLHSIVNAVSDPILLTDPEGRLLIANQRALTLFVAAEDESEGRRGAVAMNNMLLSSALSSKALEEAGAARRELLLVNPVDGSDMLFELLSSVTQDPRHGSGVVSILRNVGDLRRAAEQIDENYQKMRTAEAKASAERDRLNLIIDSVADPIVVTEASGETSLMNEPAERLFMLPTNVSIAKARYVQANDAHFSSFIAGMFVSPDRERVGEVSLVDPNTGAPMPVEAIAGKILSERGELTAVVSILHDRREAIEKGRLYEQLKEASDELERRIHAATADIAAQNELLRRQAMELEQASELKSQFLANMSHEFRTPLNAILGYTSMLLQGVSGPITEPVKRQLGRVESNGRHLLTIINEILDISRIEAGRMPKQISRFKIHELVAEVRTELEPIIRRSNLTVVIELARDIRPIASDRQKVKQILLNLLSNALKFTHNGQVTISANRLPDRVIAIAVADTGIGIAPADQDTIFEDFRQLDNSPTRAYGGTGLGLSICRRLSTMLGGQIKVRSELNKGSTFTLILPTRGNWTPTIRE